MVELWLLYALGVALLMGVSSLINRSILKRADPLAYALAFQIFSALFFIPLFTFEFAIPSNIEAWILAIAASILWAAIAVIGFQSYKFAEVSLKTPVGRSKILFSMLFAAIVLGEVLSPNKLLGGILVFFGVVLAAFKFGKPLGGFEDIGVKLTLLSALMTGAVAVIDKMAISYFQPSVYGFLQYALPTVWLWIAIPKRQDRLKKLMKTDGKWIILVSLFGMVWYWLLLKAYQVGGEVSVITPTLELSILISVFGGILLLKEKTDLIKRIIGSILTIIGAIVLRL